MDYFDVTIKTNFWIYVTTTKLWNDLKEHLENNTDMFISTFKYSYVGSGDIIIIYSKDKISSKTGFVCVAQNKYNQIDNSSNKINIFSDKNLNKYCYQIETCIFLPKLIKIEHIVPYLSGVESFKNKRSFTSKYLRYDSIFNKIYYDLGYRIVKSFFELNPDSVNFEDNQDEEYIDNNSDISQINSDIKSDNKSLHDQDDPDNLSDNQNSNSKGTDTNEFGNIPIMIVLCPRSLDKLVCEPDNEGNILYDHLLNCNICDVTDNGNIKTRLLNLWEGSDISYLEVDSSQDEYISALNSYYHLKNHNPFGEVDKSTIRLLNIIEQNNIYNNCMLIESYFHDGSLKEPKQKSKLILMKGKKQKTKSKKN